MYPGILDDMKTSDITRNILLEPLYFVTVMSLKQLQPLHPKVTTVNNCGFGMCSFEKGKPKNDGIKAC